MSRNQPRNEPPRDKAEDSADVPDKDGPMERFKALARGVLSVSNADLQEERRRLDLRKRRKKSGRK